MLFLFGNPGFNFTCTSGSIVVLALKQFNFRPSAVVFDVSEFVFGTMSHKSFINSI